MHLHEDAIACGATYARSYEFNGKTEPEVYTMTPDQLREIISKRVKSEKENSYEEGRTYQAKLELAGRDKFLAGLRK